MLDTTKLLAKGGNYRFAPSGGVSDRTLLDVAAQYENQVSRKITGLTPELLGKRYTTSEPILETTKYDGEGVFVSYEQSRESFAFNAPSGRVRIGLPVLEKLTEHLRAKGIQKALFRCELYLAEGGATGAKRANIADVIRVSFSGSAEEIAALRLVMLDIIMLDGKDLRTNQDKFQETWDLLGKLFGEDASAPFHRAQGSIVPEKELERIFAERIAAGQEGLVVRRLQRLDIAKIKPHLSVDAVVIGYVEGEFEGKYGVTSLLTALSYPAQADGRVLLQTFCRVGSGFTDQQREDFLGTFSALKVPAPLAMSDSDGRTIHFVRPVHMVELHGEDLVATSSKEKDNRTQTFALEGDGYKFLGLVPFPRMTFATFGRMRPDKTLSAGGARIEQVAPDLKSPQIREDAGSHPEILRRQVFAKDEAVRKLLVLKTGGEENVPYVIYWTDYSAKRKDPLKVTLECAYNETRAQALADRLIASNVTKGFIEVDAEGKPVAGTAAAAPAADAEAKPKKSRAKKE